LALFAQALLHNGVKFNHQSQLFKQPEMLALATLFCKVELGKFLIIPGPLLA
jgi:hypothetical protein